MIRRPPRSTLDRSSAASDVYKRQTWFREMWAPGIAAGITKAADLAGYRNMPVFIRRLSLIHISEPTRPY